MKIHLIRVSEKKAAFIVCFFNNVVQTQEPFAVRFSYWWSFVVVVFSISELKKFINENMAPHLLLLALVELDSKVKDERREEKEEKNTVVIEKRLLRQSSTYSQYYKNKKFCMKTPSSVFSLSASYFFLFFVVFFFLLLFAF